MNRIVPFALCLLACAHRPGPAAVATHPAESDPWQGRRDLLKPPLIKLSTKVSLGTIERWKLPDGLSVIAVPRPEVPVVTVTLAVRAGSSDASPDQAGLAQFTAALARKGTKKRTADQIADAIDFFGGDFDTGADDENSILSCHVRSKDRSLCLDLVSDVAQHSLLPESEMAEIYRQLLASVEGTKDSPLELATEHAANVYYGDDDARGRPMSKISLDSIKRADLMQFYRRWFVPNNATLVVSGQFDSKKLRQEITKWFGPWKARPLVARAEKKLPAQPAAVKIRLVDKPDATQAAIVLLGSGIAHSDPSYSAVKLMNYTLGGGGFSSRLMKAVRAEGGKTYGARSAFNARRHAGPWIISTATRSAEMVSTLKLIQAELEKIKKEGVHPEELVEAKGNLIGGYGVKLETSGDVAKALLVSELDNLPPDFVETAAARLDSVTLEQVNQSAQAQFKPAVLVVVGNMKELRGQFAAAQIPGLEQAEVVSSLDPISAKERKAK